MENITQNGSLSKWTISKLSTEDLKYSYFWTALIASAYTLIFVFGFIGNTIVILVIYTKRKMRTVTNLFILNLAIADLLVVLFCVPVTLLANIFIPWIFGWVICKVLSYAQGVSVFASVYSLVAISAQRYRSLYGSTEHSNGLTRLQTKTLIGLTWVVALLIPSPWIVVFQEAHPEVDTINLKYNYPDCKENWSNYEQIGKYYFVGANLILGFAVPVTVIAVVSGIIHCNVEKYSRENPDQQLRYKINGINKELLGIIAAFVICWLPLYILFAKIKLLDADDDNVSFTTTVFIALAQLLGASNSCVNPMLYAYHNKKFRETVSSFCRRKCQRRRRKRRCVV